MYVPQNHFNILSLLVAVLPPLLIMIFVNVKDKKDKEPKGLLVLCVVAGALSTIFSIIMENLTMSLIGEQVRYDQSLVYFALVAFLGVAVVEELGKFIALRIVTWRSRHFDYTFDGIVYSVFVSLGFAVTENIIYVVRYGLQVGLLRAVTAIPGHMSFGVYMGYYYGMAKFCQVAGFKGKKTANLWIGYLTAVIMHGLYDFLALSESQISMWVFIIFSVVMDIFVFVQIFQSAKNDTPIYRTYQRPQNQVPFHQVYQNPYYVPQGYVPPQYLQQQYGNQGVPQYGSQGVPPYGGQGVPNQGVPQYGNQGVPPYGNQGMPNYGTRQMQGGQYPYPQSQTGYSEGATDKLRQ